ncbi:hypothetical protein NDU88_004809 [Pleurodeles waltl]|uniref:Uncharacterized protein n=1 Tax=Pleurodeles waltl TaxID=8319 RepID=A0AAV7RGP3_PLEWA|nr:hypothetical protein NDU88_004809 [Pleurodeles waltl]
MDSAGRARRDHAQGRRLIPPTKHEHIRFFAEVVRTNCKVSSLPKADIQTAHSFKRCYIKSATCQENGHMLCAFGARGEPRGENNRQRDNWRPGKGPACLGQTSTKLLHGCHQAGQKAVALEFPDRMFSPICAAWFSWRSCARDHAGAHLSQSYQTGKYEETLHRCPP